MHPNRVTENVLATIGTVCWTGQIIPQNWKSWRDHSTEGLSAYLMLLWAISAIFLGVYTIVQNISIPLIVQPQLFGALAALSWAQILYYTHKRSLNFCATMFIMFCIIGAGLELGMYFVTRHALERGNSRPVQFFGIMASVIIAIGLLPQYWEIWKRKEVIGISYFFLIVDILGGLFSVLSLIFKTEFDTVAAVTYLLVVVMDSAIIIAALILNPRARRRREGAHVEESAPQSLDFTLPEIKENTDIETRPSDTDPRREVV